MIGVVFSVTPKWQGSLPQQLIQNRLMLAQMAENRLKFNDDALSQAWKLGIGLETMRYRESGRFAERRVVRMQR